MFTSCFLVGRGGIVGARRFAVGPVTDLHATNHDAASSATEKEAPTCSAWVCHWKLLRLMVLQAFVWKRCHVQFVLFTTKITLRRRSGQAPNTKGSDEGAASCAPTTSCSSYYYSSKFARLTQTFRESKTLGLGYSSRQDAKTLSSEENNNSPKNSLPLIRPLRLGVFARDIPRLTGARSAPYENLRVLRGESFFAPFAWLQFLRRSLS